MINPILLSKRSQNVDAQFIRITYITGGFTVIDTIIFSGSQTLEEIVALINAKNPTIFYMDMENYGLIKIIPILTGLTPITDVSIIGDDLNLMLGGDYIIEDGKATSSSFGAARLPFVFDLINAEGLQGGIMSKSHFIKTLSNKDYIGANLVSSNKVIFRKGQELNLRLSFLQLDWLENFLEFSRNEALKFINGADSNFLESDEWNILTEKTDSVSTIYDYLEVIETIIGILKI